MFTTVALDLGSGQGLLTGGRLRISLLPVFTPWPIDPILDHRGEPNEDGTEPIQLLEGCEYRYQLELDAYAGPVTVEPTELFRPDTTDGRTGRLRPGLSTGRVPIRLIVQAQQVGACAVEVRSRKLDYLSQYRWMLRDIAGTFAEVVMRQFAPSEQLFGIDPAASTRTLYQQFAFLQAVVQGPVLEASLSKITSAPYVTWERTEESRYVGQGLHGTSALSRQMARSGWRREWPEGPIPTLPMVVDQARTEASVDNVPNRFVRFCLEQWRDSLLILKDLLAAETGQDKNQRALREVDILLGQLETHLTAALFLDVGRLDVYPEANQVLMYRDGYRDLMRLHLEAEVAARLAWEGGDDVYRAGQRDVAALYEYWVYLQFAGLLAELTDQPLDLRTLVEKSSRGLSLTLRRGRHQVLRGTVTRLGRRMRVELWYNRTFARGWGEAESWSRQMKPDLSLLIAPDGQDTAWFEPVWLHFDAKYRIELVEDLFGAKEEPEETFDGDVQEATSEAKREDLLKMHAYRDAIRRTAGAFVVYPGTSDEQMPEYCEVLPGLGAFALRPAGDSTAQGIGAISRFLSDVLEHVSSQLTQHERGRFWKHQAYQGEAPSRLRMPSAPFLRRPPADTLVLCGYVKNQAHFEWIQKERIYNLRADGRRGSVELGFLDGGIHFVVLYGHLLVREPRVWAVGGPPLVLGAADLEATGYPRPRGKLYLCFQLAGEAENSNLPGLTSEGLDQLRRTVLPASVVGQPFRISWLELAQSLRPGKEDTGQ